MARYASLVGPRNAAVRQTAAQEAQESARQDLLPQGPPDHASQQDGTGSQVPDSAGGWALRSDKSPTLRLRRRWCGPSGCTGMGTRLPVWLASSTPRAVRLPGPRLANAARGGWRVRSGPSSGMRHTSGAGPGPTPDELVERAMDLETLLGGDPLRAREALRRLFAEGEILLHPQPEDHYVAEGRFLPMVALAEAQTTKPPASGRGPGRCPASGCAGRI